LRQNRDRHLKELCDFLRIPSVSSLSEHAADVTHAARWLAARLESAGFESVKLLPTGLHPVVTGEWLHAPGRPTVLVYGHYDIQPADPVELWSNPPFEPVVKDDRVYARGASDDKGNLLAPVMAAEAMLKTSGRLPVNLKWFLEGQEEVGSPGLEAFVAAHRERFACDLILSADGGQWDEDQPAVCVGRRGICAFQIDVQGADRDSHSGTYGGAILNPIQALAQVLASLHDEHGRVSVEGFYAAVRPLSAAERQEIDRIPFDEAAYKKALGVEELFGESGYTTYERTWVRPTLEINGIGGGFQGEGIKTVLPSRAWAKITCRLVPRQRPDEIFNRIRAHVETRAPRAVRVTIDRIPGDAEPYEIPPDHPGNLAAQAVLNELYGKRPHVVRTGGTIPVSPAFLKILGIHMVNFAFGLKDENIHAPDEFFRIRSFELGQKAYGMLLERLAREAP
jgi:acetylornithine deacetylase/succinyl-diaminopimelate desuccinylase-like protein